MVPPRSHPSYQTGASSLQLRGRPGREKCQKSNCNPSLKLSFTPNFLEGQMAFSHPRLGNNRSVMPLAVWGCTQDTLAGSVCAYHMPAGSSNPWNTIRDGDPGLQLLPMNKKFPVSAGHKFAVIKSLPFTYHPSLLPIGWFNEALGSKLLKKTKKKTQLQIQGTMEKARAKYGANIRIMKSERVKLE